MKKILIVHNILWSHYKAIVFSELNTLVAQEGDELLVVHIATKGIAQKNLGLPDMALHNYPYKVIFKEDYEVPSMFRKSSAILREILLFKPDLLILPGFGEFPFWMILLAAKILRVPAILTCDSTGMDRPPARYKTFLKRIFVRACDAAFSYGTKSTEYLLSLGMNRTSVFSRCQAINNSAFNDAFQVAHLEREERIEELRLRRRSFIYVGRLNSIKNVDALIRAFDSLKIKEPLARDWGLIIVGDGPERAHLETLCAALPNADIFFAGGKGWHDIPRFHALADVFILPSISEPWGLVVNEAMACGLPVIVSDRCGSAFDLVDGGKNGFVFDPFNDDELIEHMLYFVRNPDRIVPMGINSREIMKDYTAEKAAGQMLAGIRHTLRSDTPVAKS